jgi:hypothetical protein
MKIVLMLLTITAAIQAIALPAAGAEARVPASIRLDLQMVSISAADAAALIPAFEDRKRAVTAWAQLQQMIAQDKAKLLAWPILWLQDKTEGWAENSSESILEQRFPTEFRPPEFPNIFGQPPLIFPTWGPTSPTAFVSRNLGATFSAHATVNHDGRKVSVKFEDEFVRPAGFREWRTQRSSQGIVGVLQQPSFQTAKVTAEVCVYRDQPALVGVFVFSEPELHVELHILHARAKLLPSPVPAFPNP